MSKITIESVAYHEFRDDFTTGKYKCLRYGQAFYNHFDLHKMTDQTIWNKLYEMDGWEAKEFIIKNVDFS